MNPSLNLSDFLAPGVDADEVPELAALAAARPLLDAFITLFRGTEAEVLMRLLVLREIGHEAEVPRWSPDVLRARFAYLDPVKLETVLKRLRDNALLAIGEDGQYALSDIGRNAVAALAMLLRFGDEEDAELGFLTAQLAGLQAVGGVTAESLGHLLSKLTDLTWHFEEAIASGSEFRILDARRRLSANGRWIERGTDILNKLLADPDADFDIARVAQRIGLAQSRLARADASFQRALNKIEAQRVTLGGSGISSSDVAAWLRRLDGATLASLAGGCLAAVPELPLLAGGHELLDRAESALGSDRARDEADASLPPPDTAPVGIAPETEDLAMLEHFTHRLEALPGARPLHHVVAGGGFAPASYRLSLLALLADGEDASPVEGPVGAFMRLPLDVRFGDELAAVGEDEIAAINTGEVIPRAPRPPRAPAPPVNS
ncbi:hypothetical protein [Thauera linaloolentis]|uniref:Uncharacterized protein n=1 Tax=Thauera linaloolentis (strain DSM 12138 / JCM 21573 / CCUG 41526 / CIP 105981 / IAM 15112 / NBRC 102519 / 47Lol) TaxID=1123367 RepID=N6YX99_THAL4|nr:hypothetical protein [Thauera linaloolentis]ENO87027.1 hypothetical protein C666_11885 [Thauera linaloolentis 47Lol = DSM 12138]MCM8565799.1 hypothetical protein [Thauera linaloolentis]